MIIAIGIVIVILLLMAAFIFGWVCGCQWGLWQGAFTGVQAGREQNYYEEENHD